MDETKETLKDTSSEKETPPGGSEGTTPKETKTFTEEDVEKRMQADRVARGRDAKSLETRETALKAQEDANRAASIAIEQQRLDTQRKELESVADDPEAKKALLRQFDFEKRERDFKLQMEKSEAQIQAMFSDAESLAAEYNLKPSDLLVATSPEAMKLLAKNLALERELEATKTKGQTSQDAAGFKLDSNISDAAPTDFKQLRDNFIKDPWKYGKTYKEALAKRGQ